MFLVVLLVVVVIASLWVFFREGPLVCFEEECFSVEIADSIEDRTTGLMFRESLDSDSGMLFIFEEEGIYGFWMKNTLIPLDIIWLDSEGGVVEIITADPCVEEECESFVPSRRARYVLELNSGDAERIGLEVGDELVFDGV